MRKPTGLLLVLIGVAMSGCGDEGRAPVPTAQTAWSVESQPHFVVGGHDERESHVLHNVVGATRLSDGRVAIANAGTSEIRYYGPDGTLGGTAGGEGDGPGELRYMFQMVRGFGDSLIVMSRNPGLTWFDSEGRYARSLRMRHDVRPADHPCRHAEGVAWTLRPNGERFLLLRDDFSPASCPETPEGVWRRTGLLGLANEDNSAFDTVLVMPADERVGTRYRVFGHDLLLGFADDLVYAVDTESPLVLGISYAGDTVLSAPSPYDPRLVPDSVKHEGLIEVRQPDGSTRFMPGYSNYPEHFPPIGRVLVDSDQQLWLMRYPVASEPFNTWRLSQAFGEMVPAGGPEWTVMDSAGDIVATLGTPPDLFILEIGTDYILGLKRDEFGVESVEIYALQRSAPAGDSR